MLKYYIIIVEKLLLEAAQVVGWVNVCVSGPCLSFILLKKVLLKNIFAYFFMYDIFQIFNLILCLFCLVHLDLNFFLKLKFRNLLLSVVWFFYKLLVLSKVEFSVFQLLMMLCVNKGFGAWKTKVCIISICAKFEKTSQ